MAELVMILGESGSGKSTSLRNFKRGEVCLLNVAGKRPPFRNDWDAKQIVNNATYAQIKKAVSSGVFKRYVIDDSQYLMAFEAFDRSQETGYGKFTDMARNFYTLMQTCRLAVTRDGKPTDDTIVYFLHHIDKDEDGHIKPKTQGKMLDQQLNIAGLFGTILLAKTDGKDHWFETQNDGTSVAKSPMGMFSDVRIENDLKMVDDTYRAYYGMEG